MTVAAQMLPEFDMEMATTRRVLQRLPEERFGWRPHAKSFTAGELASHIANMLGWVALTLDRDGLDVAPAGGPPMKGTLAASSAALLAEFDRNAAAARTGLEAADDARMAGPWSLLAGGKVLFTMPRATVVRSFVLNHVIHHRAQLAVYLRLLDVPVPAIYGPSADEGQLG